MKPNGAALAFEHGTAEVVVDQGPRDPGKAPGRPRHARARKLSSVWSSVKSADSAREYDSTITKPESGRVPWPIRIDPKGAPVDLGLFRRSAWSGGDRPSA